LFLFSSSKINLLVFANSNLFCSLNNSSSVFATPSGGLIQEKVKLISSIHSFFNA
jgi:hypothetical protein